MSGPVVSVLSSIEASIVEQPSAGVLDDGANNVEPRAIAGTDLANGQEGQMIFPVRLT
jgi:hypothetical protein